MATQHVTHQDVSSSQCPESISASFRFACPSCRAPLVAASPVSYICQQEGHLFGCEDGIWRFLLPESQEYFSKFVHQYSQVRQMEGRGSPEPEYYRSLPFHDQTGRFFSDWRIRARSYTTFLSHVLKPLEQRTARSLRILDLGAGNGWLSYQMAKRGHLAAAVDLLTGEQDGLGAHRHYDAAFLPVQAEFDRLPFIGSHIDLVIFNASLHYSENYNLSLREALRVLRRDGVLVVLDTPVYQDAKSGRQMVVERQASFSNRFGFRSDALASENYLTFDRLKRLEAELGIRWQVRIPFYSLGWLLRPIKAKLLRRREPARFALLAARPSMESL